MKNLIFAMAAAAMIAAACAQSADAKAPAARTVTVDTRASVGHMNLRLNGGNGYTPIARLDSGGWKVFIKPMENLHLPIVRTHDTILMDDGVKTVDVHMIFANFRADENNPDNYWFKQTDEYLGRAVKDGAKILFRLGESIEHGLIKYFVHPPEDIAKWARICSHIVDHYNNGWADGFHWNIEYWEIWNEPDARPACWTGDDADRVHQEHLVLALPLQVAGRAACQFPPRGQCARLALQRCRLRGRERREPDAPGNLQGHQGCGTRQREDRLS